MANIGLAFVNPAPLTRPENVVNFAKKCEAMAGLTKEADEMAEETEKGSMTRDVALIAAGQKVEHYEIATYGTLVQLASDMHLNEVASLLEDTLKEEKETDVLLTQIAENKVNWQAVEGAKGGSGQNGNKKNAKK